MIKSNKSFDSEERLMDIIQNIVGDINRTVNESTPIVDATLASGARINVVLNPLAINGPIVTIRKFTKQTILPTKRKQKQKLSKEEITRNREIPNKRIVGEHVFASIKRFKIIGLLYCDNLKKLHKITNIIAGIHNLNIK